jgi:hypothetical protein
VLVERVEVHGIGLRAELTRGTVVFNLQDCLTGVDEGGQRVALAVLEALLVERPVEGGEELRHLVEVILQRGREATDVGRIGQELVVAELIGRAEREAGVVGVPIHVVKLDAVEAFRLAQVQAVLDDRTEDR